MQVETYEVPETVSSDTIEALAAEGEAQMLIESLGLDGQKELFCNAEGQQAHHPYRAMTKEEHAVFSTLFPNTTALEKYSDGPIPLRVLQVAAHVRSLNREDMAYIGIMHPDKFVDDPVLFAQKSYHSGTRYILARWGNALEDFDSLRTKALAKAKESTKARLHEIRRNIDRLLDEADSYTEGKWAEGKAPSPMFFE